MALFRGIQEYIALDANNITLVFDSGNIVNISGNIFLYPPQGHPILYNYPCPSHGLVRSLKSSHKEAVEKPLLCEVYSDLVRPTSNHISDIYIYVSVVYGTSYKFFFTHVCSYCLIH